MKRTIEFLNEKPLFSILLTLLFGFVIVKISSMSAKPVSDFLIQKMELNFYTKNVVFKFFMLVYSLLAILVFNKGSFANYGFIFPQNFKYLGFSLRVMGISAAALVFGSLLFMAVLNHLFPTGNSTGFPEQKSLLQMILTVWIWSSLCEEVLVRGFIQGRIQKFQKYRFFKLSLPVLVSGLFFGAMHLSLIKAGMGPWFVAFIVFNTSVLGIVAAYYREKSGSLFPAFLAHFLANFIGSIPLIIRMLIA